MLKRYTASADTTITNAYQSNLATRGTGANAGHADVLETFSVYGRQTENTSTTEGSQELSRILLKFPITDITTDRTNSVIPASGSVSFYLRMFNARHSKTVPVDYTLSIRAVAQTWQEGVGLDLENYSDITRGSIGANWMSASNTMPWTGSSYATYDSVGGSYRTGSADPQFNVSLTTGLEDIRVDITPLVEHWIADTITNNGIGVHFSSSYEASASVGANTASYSVLPLTGGATVSYYTKRFFARGSEYFFKRPVVEARWDNRVVDQRGDFYYSSSMAQAADNLNTIYLYNYIRGQLSNLPGTGSETLTGSVLVSLYSGSADDTAPSGSKLILYDSKLNITGGYVSTGIYSASVAITAASTPVGTLYDIWHSGSTEYATASFKPKTLSGGDNIAKPIYYLNITNLHDKYRSDETARFNLYVRNKNWNPTIYTKAKTSPPVVTIYSASYRVLRTLDAYEAVPYGTGSDYHTYLSHDVSGNYFDFDMGLLEPGYEYAFKFSFYDAALRSWMEQNQTFKFRVEDYEY
jgi:hypothetical protein